MIAKLNQLFKRRLADINLEETASLERRLSKDSKSSKESEQQQQVEEGERCCTLHPSNKLHGECLPLPDSVEEAIFDMSSMLHMLMESRDARALLVNELTQYNADYCVRVRFCAAVNECLATESAVERAAKAKSIVNMFLAQGSMFQLSGVRIQAAHRLSKGESVSQELETVKSQFLDEFAHNCMVQGAIARAYKEFSANKTLARGELEEEKEEE